jgi:ribonuclease J
MSVVVADGTELRYDRLSLIPLGGQSEIGQVLWAVSYAGEILLIDAGACYPGTDLPGVDLLLPNTNFLQVNQSRISALVLTNGHEEHSGAVAYLLNHLKIPRILAPRFVSALVSQTLMSKGETTYDTVIDTVEIRHPYQIGNFEVEWIQVNDAIADACALRISTPEGVILYTSSFKLDQTPIDSRLMDVGRLAQIGDSGVTLLLSDSAGVENPGYTPSEKRVAAGMEKHITSHDGRAIVVMNGTNTHRLQILFDLAKRIGRKVVLYGDTLVQTALAAVITGNLVYDRSIEAPIEDVDGDDVLVVATGDDGDALGLLHNIAHNRNSEITLRKDDLIIFSAEIYPGRSRRVAVIMDQLLSQGVKAAISNRDGVHVSNHASQEELKLMLSITKPKYFVPAVGEGRHIVAHKNLAAEYGLSSDAIFPLRNGEILEIASGGASVVGSIEAEAVLYNRDQAESVTRFSVNERRSLSMEGVLTVGCIINAAGDLVQPPVLEGAALGFTNSNDWKKAREELLANILDAVAKHKETESAGDINSLRATLREVTSKTIRSKLQSKPTIQIVVHEMTPQATPRSAL